MDVWPVTHSPSRPWMDEIQGSRKRSSPPASSEEPQPARKRRKVRRNRRHIKPGKQEEDESDDEDNEDEDEQDGEEEQAAEDAPAADAPMDATTPPLVHAQHRRGHVLCAVLETGQRLPVQRHLHVCLSTTRCKY